MKFPKHAVRIFLASFDDRLLRVCKASALSLAIINADMALATTTSTFVPGAIAASLNGFVAEGSAINPGTGRPFRHLWISDHLRGLCRIDPDLDTASMLPPGSAALNLSTCSIGGPVAYDPDAQKVYIADSVTTKLNKGLVRQSFLPLGDDGHGTLDPQMIQLGDATSCDLTIYRPSAMAQGPDGNLYIGFEHSGHVMRVNEPGGDTMPCTNFQRIGSGADGEKARGLAWVKHTLYGLGGSSPWKIINADRCLTPDAPHACQAAAVFNLPPRQAGNIYGGIGSDQRGASPNGRTLYLSDIASVTTIEDPNETARTTTNWVKSNAPAAGASMTQSAAVVIPDVFIAEGQAEGGGQLHGLVFNTSEEYQPKEPAAPSNINATAGDGSAVVNWTPGSNGSGRVNGYIVHTFIPPDLVHEVGSQIAPATSPELTHLTITGLSNGTPYVFKVTATNEVGVSPASIASNRVTPKPAIQADAPQNLTATAGNGAVALAWQPPLSDGGNPISSYLVEYRADDSLQMRSVPGNATGTTLTGLSNEKIYTANVKAINASGPGLESHKVFLRPTATVSSLDLALSMCGPAEVKAGGNAVYDVKVTNTGTQPAPQVRIESILPASGFGSAIFSTTQGACLPVVGTTLTCNLGEMASGQTGTVTITLTNVAATVRNDVSVAIYQANGVMAIADSMPVDNTVSMTTLIAPRHAGPERHVSRTMIKGALKTFSDHSAPANATTCGQTAPKASDKTAAASL